jgi:hypothetical protein
MRQMFAGGTKYSPDYQVLRDTIEFWSRILKLRKQIKTSLITIKRMAKKLKLSYPIAIKPTLQTANYNLTQAYKELRKAKPTAYKKAPGISKRPNQVPYHTKANTKRIQKRPYRRTNKRRSKTSNKPESYQNKTANRGTYKTRIGEFPLDQTF